MTKSKEEPNIFIRVYRIKEKGKIVGYSFNEPETEQEKKITEERQLSFEAICKPKDFIEEDNKVLVALFPTMGKAVAFTQGVLLSTVRGKHVHNCYATQFDKDSYAVMVEYLDLDRPEYVVVDYRHGKHNEPKALVYTLDHLDELKIATVKEVGDGNRFENIDSA